MVNDKDVVYKGLLESEISASSMSLLGLLNRRTPRCSLEMSRASMSHLLQEYVLLLLVFCLFLEGPGDFALPNLGAMLLARPLQWDLGVARCSFGRHLSDKASCSFEPSSLDSRWMTTCRG